MERPGSSSTLPASAPSGPAHVVAGGSNVEAPTLLLRRGLLRRRLRRRFLRLFGLFFIALTVVTLAGCGGRVAGVTAEPTSAPNATEVAAPSTVELTAPSANPTPSAAPLDFSTADQLIGGIDTQLSGLDSSIGDYDSASGAPGE